MKTALTIAGSDCSGGAGIQADLKTFAAHGVYGMSAIVSVVAENTCKVYAIADMPPDVIGQQIDAVFEDIGADAVKIGMLSRPVCMEAVRERLLHYKPRNIVLDPVMVAKGGCPLMEPSSIDYLIQNILPLADVITPNLPEAEAITGERIQSMADMERAAKAIAQMGPKNVLIKGGHSFGDAQAPADAVDVLFDSKGFHYLRAARIPTKNTHGTGCTFSSAIAANLALGRDIADAATRAKDYVTTAIAHALAIGKGHGPTHHMYSVYKNGLPELTEEQ